MKKTTKRIAAILMALVAVICSLSLTAFAAQDNTIATLPDSTTHRVLNIHKYSPTNPDGEPGDGTTDVELPEDSFPLENIEFEIYQVPDIFFTSEDNVADADRQRTPTDDEIEAIAVEDNYIATVTTDEDGFATYDFGTTNGIYLVIEKDNPVVSAKAAPFYVSVPYTNADGNGYITTDGVEVQYTVDVYPKNDVAGDISIDKNVTDTDTKSDNFAIGETQTWIIRGSVPADLAFVSSNRTSTTTEYITAKSYVITDEIDADAGRLTYKGNLNVVLYTKAGEEVELADSSYTATEPAANSTKGTLTVALTESGMIEVFKNLDEGSETPEIRVYFDTAINTEAEMGVAIPNDATLDYTNSVGQEYETVEVAEDPTVVTGGLVLNKYDAATEAKLKNAEFKLYRAAKTGETADETIMVNGTAIDVVEVSFYDANNVLADTAVTNDNGYAALNGLKFGTYYLVETKAPSGYNLLSAPISVTVTKDSHQTAIDVANSAKFILPITGGAGTAIFTVVGTLCVAAAAVLLISKKKKVTD